MTLAGLSLLAVNVGLEHNDRQEAQAQYYKAEQAKTSQQFLTGQPGSPGLRVVSQSPPGAVLTRGIDWARPAYWESTPACIVEGPVGASVDNWAEPGQLLDYEAVIRVVLGLMAVLLGIRAVAGHRQDHTLQTLLDLPVPRAGLAVANFSAAVLTVALTLLLLTASLLVLVYLRASALFATELPLVVGASSAIAFAYSLVMISAGMIVGAFGRNAATAGGIGVGVWGFLTLAYPQLASFGSHVIAPTPLRAEVEGEMQAIHAVRYTGTLELLGKEVARVARELGGNEESLLYTAEARDPVEELWRADSAETRLLIEAVERRASTAAARRERLVDWLAAPNPAMLLGRILGAVADTGSATEHRWSAALQANQKALVAQHYDDPPRLALRVPSDAAFQRILFDRKPLPRAADLPQFQPPVRDLWGRLYDARRDLGLLAAFVVITGILAVVCFPRSAS